MSLFGFGSETINLGNEQFHNDFWANFKEHLSNSESRLIPFDRLLVATAMESCILFSGAS